MKAKIAYSVLSMIVFLLGFQYYSISQQKVFYSNGKIDLKGASNIYIKDTIVDSFIGTWKWEQGGDSLIFIFKKIKKNMGSSTNHLDVDFINAGYKYFVKGINIFNTVNSMPLMGGSEGKLNTLYFLFKNEQTDTKTYLELDKINERTLIFKVSNRITEGVVPDKNFPMPTNITLTKIE